MNSTVQKIRKTNKLALLFLLTCSIQISAVTSNMTHRVMGTSPLLYKMIDYSKHQTCFEIAPIFSSMYDSSHVNSNIILGGKNSLLFDQQGEGDINPVWLNLMSNNSLANYNSTVTFTPTLSQAGVLLHWYDQYDNIFFDVKTALVQCKSEVEINEVGGGNGLNTDILNAQQAFTQSAWNYGKIGASNHVVGLDNIELRVGKVISCTSEFSSYDMLIAGFGIIEAPTGTGTKSEWLFEPQVGTNHWGVGFGFEALVSGDDDLKFMIAGNYRYLTPAWETRSFDLLGNGQWSRYLAVQDTYGITSTTSALPTLGLPGINFFTQQAYINGRSEINLYTRLQKHFQSCYFEVAYNFLCVQKETIGAIKQITPGYGIYALTGPAGGSGGATTSSTATINQDVTTLDALGSPVSVTNDRFDKISACAGTYATNTLTARVEINKDKMIYGFGASIEAAQSANAISTWSVWAQFGFLFDNVASCDENHEFAPELYNFEPETANIIHHPIHMDDAGFPVDVITSVENNFIDDNNFEFVESDVFENNEFDFDENEMHEEEEIEDNAVNSDAAAESIAHTNPETIQAITLSESHDSSSDKFSDFAIAMANASAAHAAPVETLQIDPTPAPENVAESLTKPAAEENSTDQTTLPADATTNQSLETTETKTPEEESVTAPEVTPTDSQTPIENQTISVEDNSIIPQAENGLLLASDDDNANAKEELTVITQAIINDHETTSMSDEEIAKFLHYSNKNNANAMSEAEILNTLDSTK
jgi:hypothetical protein